MGPTLAERVNCSLFGLLCAELRGRNLRVERRKRALPRFNEAEPTIQRNSCVEQTSQGEHISVAGLNLFYTMANGTRK